MRKNIIALLALLSTATLLSQETTDTTLVINEIQVANLDQYLDNANCYGGWIELYNPASKAVLLSSMHISDGVNDFRLSALHGNVPAKGFKTIWFDHYYSNGNYGSNARRQVPFKLEYEGGTISLLASDKSVLSSVTYPPAVPRCSWARTEDGGSEWATTGTPTPQATNATSSFAAFRLDAPQVDADSRVFTEGFTARVRIPSGATLRYTTDGSAPTATNGETSADGRFDISQTTILRLCLIGDGYLPSPVVTRNYIYRNHDYYLPILSICSEPKNFFDNQVGVFVKGTNGISGNGQNSACNWNMDWERPINMEYLVPSTMVNGQSPMFNDQWSMVLNQEADLEICGGWTRAYGGGEVDGRSWPTRSSFRIKTDKRYEGVHAIDYPVFPSKPHNKYRCWQVRNGGNDTYGRIKDPLIQQIVMRSGFYVDCQDYQPAHVFLNGAYYGMLNIRESNNKHFAYSNYGISFDDMDQFDLSNAQYNQKVGDNKAWTQLQTLARKLGQTKSEDSYKDVCALLDMNEYVNYMALECYIGSSDWLTNTNNVKGFRSRSDGKFHFVLFDTESAFSSSTMLTEVLNTSAGSNVDDLFRNLMKYDPFRRQFMDAYCLVDGSVFEPSRCEDIYWDIYQNIAPALTFEGSRPSQSILSTIHSAYNGSRITTLRNYFRTKFSLYATLSANIPEARLSVNGQEVPTGRFAGHLFSYNNLPIQLSATAPAGYTFRGWMSENGELISANEELDLHTAFASNSNVVLEAIFEPIANERQRWESGATPLRINEVSATGDIYINEYGKKTDWIELYNTTDHDISLAGLYLSDNPDKPQKYQIGNDRWFVPAHGTRIVWCDGREGISQPHAPFKLENTDGASVSIQAADGAWTDRLEYRKQGKWQTYGRYPDGGNLTALLEQPTIDKANKTGMLEFYDITDNWFDPVGTKPALASDSEVRAVLYYNLSGQQIAKPESGIYIRKIIYKDGSTKTTKSASAQ